MTLPEPIFVQENKHILRAKICAFCGRRLTRKNRSGEHIWADWLEQYIPRLCRDTRHTVSIKFTNPITGDYKNYTRAGEVNRPGDPHSQKLYIVCIPCNTGWMSQIQNHVKETLIPFTQHKWPTVDAKSRAILTSWITMFTMCVEFADIWTMATSQHEREQFKDLKYPPQGWTIWLGSFQSALRRPGAFNHFGHGGGISNVRGDQLLPPGVLTPYHNAQTTTFVIGSLFIQVHSSRKQGVVVDPLTFATEFANENGLRVLWPYVGGEIIAPPRVLGGLDADRISRLFMPARERSGARPVWGPRPDM